MVKQDDMKVVRRQFTGSLHEAVDGTEKERPPGDFMDGGV